MFVCVFVYFDSISIIRQRGEWEGGAQMAIGIEIYMTVAIEYQLECGGRANIICCGACGIFVCKRLWKYQNIQTTMETYF